MSSRFCVVAVLLIAGASLCRAADPQSAALKEDAPRVERPVDPTEATPAEQDLAEMQGVWLYEYANAAGVKMRVEKKVDGESDVVTQYDAAGNVVYSHASTFQLERHGPLRVFTILTSVVTAGPDMGMQRGKLPRSFVYRIEGNKMMEVWGLLEVDRGPPRVILWQKREAGR